VPVFKKGLLPKDMIEKLKQIEKLSKAATPSNSAPKSAPKSHETISGVRNLSFHKGLP